jgi:ATP synthase protein I
VQLDKFTGILLELRPLQREKKSFLQAAKRTMPQSQDPLYAGLGQAVRIGTELLAALIVGGGLGWVVDTYVLETTPWGLVIGLMLGAGAGVRNAYRMAQRWPK